jgi:hypothetical protein
VEKILLLTAANFRGDYLVTTEAVYEHAIHANFKSGSKDVVIPTNIPTKEGPIEGYALNWVASFKHDFKVKPPISTELFYSQFEHAFGPLHELPERERMKYVYTTEFINKHLSDG